MKNNYTHLTMVIDSSGSMASSWPDVVGGYASLIKENKAAEGAATISLLTFNYNNDWIFEFSDIQTVSDVLDPSIWPLGGTALRDAVGSAIQKTGHALAAMTESERPSKVLIVIQTDGCENTSKEYTDEQIKLMIKEQQEKYNWEFLFVGQGKEIEEQGVNMGFKGSTIHYSNVNTGKDFDSIGQKLIHSRN
jgi:Mg-chelatase subunit ChlD